jgi:hypothetical protein
MKGDRLDAGQGEARDPKGGSIDSPGLEKGN